MSRVFLLLVVIVSPLYAQHNGNFKTEMYNGQESVANEVLVKFRPTTLAAILQAQISEDVNQTEELGSIGVLRFHSASKNVATLVRDLAARADVEYVEPNYIVHAIGTTSSIPSTAVSPRMIPNDPRFSELWGLQNTVTP